MGDKMSIYVVIRSSNPSQNPPSAVMFSVFFVICIGMGVLEITLKLNLDNRCIRTTLTSITGNLLPVNKIKYLRNLLSAFA